MIHAWGLGGWRSGFPDGKDRQKGKGKGNSKRKGKGEGKSKGKSKGKRQDWLLWFPTLPKSGKDGAPSLVDGGWTRHELGEIYEEQLLLYSRDLRWFSTIRTNRFMAVQ